MRNRLLGRIALTLLATLAGASLFSWTKGQTPPPRELPPSLNGEFKSPAKTATYPIQPVLGTNSTPVPKMAATPAKSRVAVPFDRFRNLEALPELTKQMVVTAFMGMEWLYRYNQPNGLFLHGYLPAVNLPMEGDHFLYQACAAFALARAARFTGDERFTVRANQAVLTMLSGTVTDASAPGIRRPAAPSIACNRLATAGFLAMTIHELPEPASDLLAKADELTAFIRSQQRDDGSLIFTDSPAETADSECISQFAGPAIYALALNYRVRPASQKLESLRKTVGIYRKRFKEHPEPDLIPWMTAACTECYLATKENAFAEFTLEMNDWLCGLQYPELPDPRQPLWKPSWRGGFKSVSNGKVDLTPPGIQTALYAQSLADACRLLRQMPSPDLQRYDRYRASLIRSLQFVATLQFTEGNTLHIASKYRSMLVGGFHPTASDGNLRVDQTAIAVSAFIQFFASGADRAQ